MPEWRLVSANCKNSVYGFVGGCSMDDNLIKKINKHLADEESKDIMCRRVLFSLTGDEAYINPLGKNFRNSVISDSRWIEFVDLLESASDNGLVMYGAGAYGQMIIQMSQGIKWVKVIDNNGIGFCEGIAIAGVDEFLNAYSGETIVISSRKYREEMEKNLISHGVSKDRIIDGTIIWELTEGKQYFDLDALKPCGNEVFVDMGACDGLTSVWFMKWCNGNGYCYCFEPDKANYECLVSSMRYKGIEVEKAYTLIKKGNWDKDTTLSFEQAGNAASHIVEDAEETQSPNVVQIPVVALDNCLGEKGVTFIKMDIEGAELKALKGAQKIIQERKPKLAICVYHKPEDIWEIPEYILSLRDDYKLYLRHYSFGDMETVLYAI